MNWMGTLQQLGRSLMIPTIALPVAAVLLSLGALPWHVVHMDSIGQVMDFAGNAIFNYLPIIFAVGVALGLTDNAGTAGMSALLGYLLFNEVTLKYIGSQFQLGVTGGIGIGIISALAYYKFRNIKFPEYFQVFGGNRFVILFVGFISLILSATMIGIGSYFQNGIILLGNWLLSLGGFGVFLYGVAYRLLVPTGLHHILNNIYWFQAGSYVQQDGHIVYGDLPRFFAGDPTAGYYMAGLYPIMMFALPAIAFAIIHEAREDLKPKIRTLFLTAALSSFLTGVSEPIEFAFLFVAPYLFIVHALLSGLAMWIAYIFNIHAGFSYSAGMIDFIVNEHLAKHGLWLIPIGIVYGLVYYFLFRWAIVRFRIPTPGREEGSILEEWAGDIPYRSPLILQALGGKNNIKTIEACITRLRLTLENDRLIDIPALKHLGAAGIIRLGAGNYQVVFGTYSELIREEIMKVVRKDIQPVLFDSPVQGKMIPLAEVPDPVFAQGIVGNGVAFIPDRGEVIAPISGKIAFVHPSMHALGITTKEGLEVMLHIGIDTAHLPGKLFTAQVKEGDEIVAGQLLIKFNLQKVKQLGKSMAIPLIIMNPKRVKSWSFIPFKAVKKGQKSVMYVVLKDQTQFPQGGSEDE